MRLSTQVLESELECESYKRPHRQVPFNSRHICFRIAYRLKPTQMKQHHNSHQWQHRDRLSLKEVIMKILIILLNHHMDQTHCVNY